MNFPTDLASIRSRIQSVQPEGYGRTRNFIDGKVTYLSPYISRGVISTKQVFEHLQTLDLEFYKIEKMVQELAWRDYWQQVWKSKGDAISSDLKHHQNPVLNHGVPLNITQATTGVEGIDQGIETLYQTGYMHNHVRMYTAGVTCNLACSHWKLPAQWMYYHLLDGDWASNALSWQWVAGTNSNKKYIANQENINKYCHTTQRRTFLDVSYEQFNSIRLPSELSQTHHPVLETVLPVREPLELQADLPVLVYNYYNLDPEWNKDLEVSRVLLLEPSKFKEFPVSKKCLDFAMELSNNIPDLHLFVGEFEELQALAPSSTMIFKEHPLNQNYQGEEQSRDWMFEVEGDYPSFFAFWKKCKKQL